MDQIRPMWSVLSLVILARPSLFSIRFSWLPVTEDVDEAPFVYGFLADLVEGNNPHILGANNSNLPRVVAVIAEALAVDVLPPDHAARQRIVSIVKQVQVSLKILFSTCFEF